MGYDTDNKDEKNAGVEGMYHFSMTKPLRLHGKS